MLAFVGFVAVLLGFIALNLAIDAIFG